MTKEEIIEMAEQAGFMFTEHGSPIGFTHSMLEDFAKLVAEKEREACAKIAEKFGGDWCVDAIRSREQE
jgi:hypothetical protein